MSPMAAVSVGKMIQDDDLTEILAEQYGDVEQLLLSGIM